MHGGTHDAPPSATEPDGVDKEGMLCSGVDYRAKTLVCDGLDVRFTGASVPCLSSEGDALQHPQIRSEVECVAPDFFLDVLWKLRESWEGCCRHVAVVLVSRDVV